MEDVYESLIKAIIEQALIDYMDSTRLLATQIEECKEFYKKHEKIVSMTPREFENTRNLGKYQSNYEQRMKDKSIRLNYRTLVARCRTTRSNIEECYEFLTCGWTTQILDVDGKILLDKANTILKKEGYKLWV